MRLPLPHCGGSLRVADAEHSQQLGQVTRVQERNIGPHLSCPTGQSAAAPDLGQHAPGGTVARRRAPG